MTKEPPFAAVFFSFFCFFGKFFLFPLDFFLFVCYYTLEHRVSDVIPMFDNLPVFGVYIDGIKEK